MFECRRSAPLLGWQWPACSVWARSFRLDKLYLLHEIAGGGTPAIQQQLALSSKQVKQLDAIFTRDRAARIELYKKITRLDAELRQTIEIGEADDATVMRLSDELGTLRRQRNIGRYLMLLAMYKVLTVSQRVKLMSPYRGLPSPPP